MRKIEQQAFELLRDHVGITTAELYRDFYAEKDEREIRISVLEILSELYGERQAKKLLVLKGMYV